MNAVQTVDGDVIHFAFPTQECTLNLKAITDEEKEVVKEFFDNRPSKTPERYMRIRNYILETWYSITPSLI